MPEFGSKTKVLVRRVNPPASQRLCNPLTYV